MGILTRASVRLLSVLLPLAATVVAMPTPPAMADDPGVYDITLNRAYYPASGSMTVTWRGVIPSGTTSTGDATCTLILDGVERSTLSCRSGEPFSYDLGSTPPRGSLAVRVSQLYADPSQTMYLFSVTGTSADVGVDGQPPIAGVTYFRTLDGTNYAPDPMLPATAYRASLVWNDNLSVTGSSCRLERIDPAPVVTVGTVVSCNTGGSHGGSVPFTTPSSSGTYRLVLTVTDPAGNQGTGGATFRVDASPPALTFAAGPGDGEATNAARPAWSWTADEAGTFACWAGPAGASSVLTTCDSPFTAPTLADGANQLQVRATDAHGNSGVTVIDFVVDSRRPTLSGVTPADGSVTGERTLAITAQADEPVTFLCSAEPNAAVPAWSPCSPGAAPTTRLELAREFGFGAHQFGVKAVDAAGNVSDPALTSFTVMPSVSGEVSITGSARVGSRLTATGAWPSTATLSYQWLADGAPIPGADGAGFVPTAAQLGERIAVRVTGSEPGFLASTRTSAEMLVGPGTLTGGPTRITGKLKAGKVLRLQGRGWPSGTSVKVRWYVGGKAVSNRTVLRLRKGWVGKQVKVQVVGTRPGYRDRVITLRSKGPVKRT